MTTTRVFQRSWRRCPAAVLPYMLLIAVTGCGSDDTTSAADDASTAATATTTTTTTTTATTPTPASSGFCEAVVDFDAISSPGGPEEPTADDMRAFAEQIRPLVDTMIGSAPAGASAAVDTLDDAVNRAAEGDLSVSDDPDLDVALAGIEQAVRDHCDVAIVDVVGADYSFEAPDVVPAGPVSFRLINEGEQLHVLLLLKAPPDVTDDVEFLDRFLGAANSGDPDAFVEFEPYDVEGNPLVAGPGGAGTAVKMLEPGEYLYFCPIPLDFTDPASQTHVHVGMHGRFTVEG